MLEIDCRICENLGDDECNLYGKDCDIAVEKCASDGFANYTKMTLDKLIKRSINHWHGYLVIHDEKDNPYAKVSIRNINDFVCYEPELVKSEVLSYIIHDGDLEVKVRLKEDNRK